MILVLKQDHAATGKSGSPMNETIDYLSGLSRREQETVHPVRRRLAVVGGPKTTVPWLFFGNQQLAATTVPSMQSAEAFIPPSTAVLRAAASKDDYS